MNVNYDRQVRAWAVDRANSMQRPAAITAAELVDEAKILADWVLECPAQEDQVVQEYERMKAHYLEQAKLEEALNMEPASGAQVQ